MSKKILESPLWKISFMDNVDNWPNAVESQINNEALEHLNFLEMKDYNVNEKELIQVITQPVLNLIARLILAQAQIKIYQ